MSKKLIPPVDAWIVARRAAEFHRLDQAVPSFQNRRPSEIGSSVEHGVRLVGLGRISGYCRAALPATAVTSIATRRQDGNRGWQPRRKSASLQTRTQPSQGQNAGSNPAGATILSRGARTIRHSCNAVPRRTVETCRRPRFICSIPATLPSKPMQPRSASRLTTSWRGSCHSLRAAGRQGSAVVRRVRDPVGPDHKADSSEDLLMTFR